MKKTGKSKARMTEKEYERTDMDKRNDRKMAKKKGQSVKKWERSKEDARMDKAAVKKINTNRKAKKR